MRGLINRLLVNLEWRLSLGGFIWGIAFPAGSFALPAWAAEAAGVFAEYAPLSWVVAGFGGLLAYAVAAALYGYGQMQVVRSRYNKQFMIETGGVDPLAKVFEGKRIYLNDFILPSNPSVEGKTFVDCEIVGPGNIFLFRNNNISNIRQGKVDAVVLNGTTQFLNGYDFENCAFRGCTFHRITLFFQPNEVSDLDHLEWLNWISIKPSITHPASSTITAIEDQSDQSPPAPGA